MSNIGDYNENPPTMEERMEANSEVVLASDSESMESWETQQDQL